VLYHNQKDS
jgi:hypothetical protein